MAKKNKKKLWIVYLKYVYYSLNGNNILYKPFNGNNLSLRIKMSTYSNMYKGSYILEYT